MITTHARQTGRLAARRLALVGATVAVDSLSLGVDTPGGGLGVVSLAPPPMRKKPWKSGSYLRPSALVAVPPLAACVCVCARA